MRRRDLDRHRMERYTARNTRITAPIDGVGCHAKIHARQLAHRVHYAWCALCLRVGAATKARTACAPECRAETHASRPEIARSVWSNARNTYHRACHLQQHDTPRLRMHPPHCSSSSLVEQILQVKVTKATRGPARSDHNSTCKTQEDGHDASDSSPQHKCCLSTSSIAHSAKSVTVRRDGVLYEPVSQSHIATHGVLDVFLLPDSHSPRPASSG